MQTIKIGGETYTLQFGFAAANLLQELSRKPLLVLVGSITQGDTQDTLNGFYAATRMHHGSLDRAKCEAVLDKACDDPGFASVIMAVATELGRMLNLGAAKPKDEPQKKVPGSTKKAS